MAYNAMFDTNKLILGLAGANCSGGQAITKVAERWSGSWDKNLALATMADDAGFDFNLPIGRWIGFGGTVEFHNRVLETMTWAAGLLGVTRRMTMFSTVHTAFFHPIVAAKQIATMDHIGSGRYGLNIVCGANQLEYEMFGIPFPSATTARYAYGQEWFDIIRKIWTSTEPFDWHGTHFDLQHVYGDPKPFGGKLPLTMNAGGSGPGRDFGARNADCCFVVMGDPDRDRKTVSDIKDHAQAAYGRDVSVFTACHVVCRPTAKDAQDYYLYYADEQADWPAVDKLIEVLGIGSKSFPEEYFKIFRRRFAGGHGSYPIVGDPDYVADELERISKAGYAGTTLSFVDFLGELPYFCDEVMPRLRKKGLRK